jgi:acetyl esterase
VRTRSLSELTVAEARAQEQAAIRSRVVELEPIREVRELAIPGPAGALPARAYLPGGLPRPAPVLVWFPGGGWVLGSLEAADPVCRKLANETPCAVVAVEYRQAPEHRFPAAVEDCLAAAAWVASVAGPLALDPSRVAIGGASAGGNLAAVVVHLARDRGEPQLVLQLLVYPPTDRGASGDVVSQAPNETAFARADVNWCWSHYLGDASGEDPRASPLRSRSFRDLPPALVITAEQDPLHDEGARYAERLAAAGVEVEHAHYNASHGFFSTPGSSVSDAARSRAVAVLRRAFGEDKAGGAQ